MKNKEFVFGLCIFMCGVAILVVFYLHQFQEGGSPILKYFDIPSFSPPPKWEFFYFQKFESLEDFESYLAKLEKDFSFIETQSSTSSLRSKLHIVQKYLPEIVQEDGVNIYFSSKKENKIKVIRIFPPEKMQLVAQIENVHGNLLLAGKNLIVFAKNAILGYETSDSNFLQKKWELKIKEGNLIFAQKSKTDKIYLVTKTFVNKENPCPISSFLKEKEEIKVKCVDIYYPKFFALPNVIFSVFLLNPENGEIENDIAFFVPSPLSFLYFSDNNLYLILKNNEPKETLILKVSLLNFEIVAERKIPGSLLDEFALNEYQGKLKLAVKFEGKDNIYVLDSKLKILSKIENLNIPEEISSVRFLGNKCFISTLNEEGPVYVIDLLFAQSVKFKLESKISTNFAHLYLISKEKVLGIEKEKEKEKTKISLLDLNSTESPKELSSYIVKDSLFDRQKEFKIFQGKEDLIFVGEGGNKTYFISIKQNQILMKTIDQKGIEGAVSDQNFFYLIFEDKIFVFDKSNLEKIKEIPI